MILSWIIWSLGIGLEALVLYRGFRAKMLKRYPFFYGYSASVLAMATVLLSASLKHRLYWPMQLITLIIGYGILLEILKHVLAPYPGADKFARTAVVAVFLAVTVVAFVVPIFAPHWSHGTLMEFERDLRMVQAVFIFSLVSVIGYYGIEIGRNMKGMIFGYGLYIGASLVVLATRAYTVKFDEAWKVIQPLSFDVSLLIWVAALWAYHANPVAQSKVDLEADYEQFLASTRGTIGAMRAHLVKAAHQ